MRDTCGRFVRDVGDIGDVEYLRDVIDVANVAYLGDVRGEGDMADVRYVGYDSNGRF